MVLITAIMLIQRVGSNMKLKCHSKINQIRTEIQILGHYSKEENVLAIRLNTAAKLSFR